MDFIVYTYGGAEMLWKIFNAMAMIATSTYFHKLSILMIGVALLTVASRAIPAASIPFLFKKWILPTFFLMAFFWGPKVTVNLVDNIDTTFKAAPVANVPFGIAFAASISSKMSAALTDVIEKFMVSSDMERFSQVGPMFGARLMYEARTLTIRDPIMRENIKDFTRQCFAWPYIFTNIAPGKKAAMESQDMLGFIEANAHKSLGMYWRKSTGETEFMFCGKCAAKVREVIPLEVETGFKSLASSLFGGSADTQQQTHRLKQYFGDAWQFIAKGSSDAASVIQQELMLNAYRAALQDKREEFGLPRNPALSYLNAERGQVHQDESFLVKAALSGTQIPNLHTLLMCFALFFFTVVAPFTFVSGGLHLITTFAKVMLWLATWPPLFSILNALGHMYLAKATSGQMMGYGEGLNVMTQNGLADTAYHTYAFVMGLQYSVPFLAWAMLSGGGGYALSQFSTFLTQGGESFAGKAASEMVDGNVSFDSQTLHHKSIANTQMAQQQLGASFNYGSRIDDGSLATLYGQTKEGELDRTPTFQQHLTQMGTNLTQNDAVSSAYALEARKAYSAGLTNSKSAAYQAQLGMNETLSLMEGLANAKGFNQAFGDSANSSGQSAFTSTIDKVRQLSKDHNISESSVLNAAIGVGAKIDPVGFAKGISAGALGASKNVGVGIDINGNYATSTKESEALSKMEKSGELEQVARNLSHALNYLEDNKGSINDTATKNKLYQMQQHYNTSKQFSDQAAVNYQDSDYYSQSASMQRQKGVSSSSNITDQALGALAHERGGDIYQAAQEASQNPQALKTVVSRQIDINELGMRTQGSEQAMKEKYETLSNSIESRPSHDPAIAQGRKVIQQESDELSKKVDDKQKETKSIGEFTRSIAGASTGLEVEKKMKEQEFEDESKKGVLHRTVRRITK